MKKSTLFIDRCPPCIPSQVEESVVFRWYHRTVESSYHTHPQTTTHPRLSLVGFIVWIIPWSVSHEFRRVLLALHRNESCFHFRLSFTSSGTHAERSATDFVGIKFCKTSCHRNGRISRHIGLTISNPHKNEKNTTARKNKSNVSFRRFHRKLCHVHPGVHRRCNGPTQDCARDSCIVGCFRI